MHAQLSRRERSSRNQSNKSQDILDRMTLMGDSQFGKFRTTYTIAQYPNQVKSSAQTLECPDDMGQNHFFTTCLNYQGRFSATVVEQFLRARWLLATDLDAVPNDTT